MEMNQQKTLLNSTDKNSLGLNNLETLELIASTKVFSNYLIEKNELALKTKHEFLNFDFQKFKADNNSFLLLDKLLFYANIFLTIHDDEIINKFIEAGIHKNFRNRLIPAEEFKKHLDKVTNSNEFFFKPFETFKAIETFIYFKVTLDFMNSMFDSIQWDNSFKNFLFVFWHNLSDRKSEHEQGRTKKSKPLDKYILFPTVDALNIYLEKVESPISLRSLMNSISSNKFDKIFLADIFDYHTIYVNKEKKQLKKLLLLNKDLLMKLLQDHNFEKDEKEDITSKENNYSQSTHDGYLYDRFLKILFGK